MYLDGPKLKPLGTVYLPLKTIETDPKAEEALKEIFPTPDVSKDLPTLQKDLQDKGFDLIYMIKPPFVKPSPSTPQQVFEEMDTNKDGKVSGQELLDKQKQ